MRMMINRHMRPLHGSEYFCSREEISTTELSDPAPPSLLTYSSDITFEPVPSSYAMLKIHTLPATGGDTLWGSAYDAYDKLSAPMKTFLEGLTATHDANFFHDEARRLGIPIKAHGRGNPLNDGDDLRAVHPIIRTNRESCVSMYRRQTKLLTRSSCTHLASLQPLLDGRVCLSITPLPSESTMSARMRASEFALQADISHTHWIVLPRADQQRREFICGCP